MTSATHRIKRRHALAYLVLTPELINVAAAQSQDYDADAEGIKLISSICAAFDNREWMILRSLLADGATMTLFGIETKGSAAISDRLETISFNAGRFITDITILQTNAIGSDAQLIQSQATITVTQPILPYRNGPFVAASYMQTDLLERINGKWLLRKREISNESFAHFPW